MVTIDATRTGAGCGSIWSLLSTGAQAPFTMDSRCWMMQFYTKTIPRVNAYGPPPVRWKWAVPLMLHSVSLWIILLALVIINWWACFRLFFLLFSLFCTRFIWKSIKKNLMAKIWMRFTSFQTKSNQKWKSNEKMDRKKRKTGRN